MVWRGTDRIKLVIVDLDGVLWPGVAGEQGHTLDDPEVFKSLRYGWFGGLHQALKILSSRGILLATCSTNDVADVRRAFAELQEVARGEGIGYLLQEADFVAHKINWRRKSDNIAELLDEVGFDRVRHDLLTLSRASDRRSIVDVTCAARGAR